MGIDENTTGAHPAVTEESPVPFVTFRHLGQVGRFGNQLFQIAATIGAARRNGCAVGFGAWPYEPLFAGRLPHPPGSLPETVPLMETSFFFRPIEVRESCHLIGFFQSEKYFAHCAAEIRSLFAPNAGIRGDLAARYGGMLAQDTCSIHVRRADYLTQPFFTQLWATDYYEKATASFGADVRFVVFSDDIAWCRMHFQGQRFTFIEGQSASDDFFLMSACAHHIIANSSFSWWAAWLGANPAKRVTAPWNWFTGEFGNPAVPFVAGPPHHGFHDTRDLIPGSWARI